MIDLKKKMPLFFTANEVPHTMRPSTERVTNTPVEKLTEKTTFYWPVTEGSTETPSDKSTYSTKIPKVTEWPTPEGPPTAFTGSYISTHSKLRIG